MISRSRVPVVAVTLLLVGVAGTVVLLSANTTTVRFVDNGITVATISVAVADTPDERETGLMNRSTLPGDGMLFVFPAEQRRTFWMKDTAIPLDIIFLDAQKHVVGVAQADPAPDVPDAALERYHSPAPARYVIEVRQGVAQEHGIANGTRAVWD